MPAKRVVYIFFSVCVYRCFAWSKWLSTQRCFVLNEALSRFLKWLTVIYFLLLAIIFKKSISTRQGGRVCWQFGEVYENCVSRHVFGLNKNIIALSLCRDQVIFVGDYSGFSLLKNFVLLYIFAPIRKIIISIVECRFLFKNSVVVALLILDINVFDKLIFFKYFSMSTLCPCSHDPD